MATGPCEQVDLAGSSGKGLAQSEAAVEDLCDMRARALVVEKARIEGRIERQEKGMCLGAGIGCCRSSNHRCSCGKPCWATAHAMLAAGENKKRRNVRYSREAWYLGRIQCSESR
jgi:hypothetical protein